MSASSSSGPSELSGHGLTAASVFEGPAQRAAAAAGRRPAANPEQLRGAAAGAMAAEPGRRGGAVHVPDSEASTSAPAVYDGLTFVSVRALFVRPQTAQ